MKVHDFIQNNKNIQIQLLRYIDNSNDVEENYQNMIQIIQDNKILSDKIYFKSFLYLLINIVNNHKQWADFYYKIEKIIKFLRTNILAIFTNKEIFNIFKNNNRILLFLIDEKILNINEKISKCLKYNEYFYPEIKSYLTDDDLDEEFKYYLADTMKIFNENNEEQIKLFYEKRKNGENDDIICQYIKKDMIEEFITHINKTGLPLSSQIESSIFEIDSLSKSSSLIELAAFYGSIQIFKYLQKNGVELVPSLWKYAIHGDDPEIIHILEENQHLKGMSLKDEKNYVLCMKEAIKCHHNDIANYIQNNYKTNDSNDIYI